jgi:hypothetical protein
VASAQVLVTLEDNALALTLAATDPDGDVLTYSIVSNPQNGILSGIGANRIYTPAAHDYGVQTLTFKVRDARGAESNTASVEIRITPVNDAPGFGLATTSVTAVKNTKIVQVGSFAINLTAGAPNEAQTIGFVTTNSNPGLFSQQPAIAANGTLSFGPAKSKAGSAIVTVYARDNGGTADGGKDTSVPKTFTITVR